VSAPLRSWGGLQAPNAVRLSQSAPRAGAAYLPVGLGRSYGDSALPARGVALTTRSRNAIVSFDRETGLIEAEAGVTIDALIDVALGAGWFAPVAPGTAQVTLGGAAANDIHGKNHHGAGSFGAHVRALTLSRSDGPTRALTPGDPLFAATIGGMGLTGLIERLTLQLMRVPGGAIEQSVVRLPNLEAFFDQIDESEARAPYNVAWIDSLARGRALGRGLLFEGRHIAGPADRKRALVRVPFTPPWSPIAPATMAAFNLLYRALAGRTGGPRPVRLDSFFFPLDAVTGWSRLYGPRGLRQHQSVYPLEAACACVRAALTASHAADQASFLTVLKRFGDRPSPGMLSFARQGVTLTLDFPYRGAQTDALLDRLDAIAIDAGGAVNPYKDARMSARTFARSFPQADAFRAFIDPMAASLLSDRVGLTGARAALGRAA
jgi:FAD/FMN-containing dehydrogenase